MKCPACNKTSAPERWEASEVPCEDCGSHPAVRCPECGEPIDTVMHAVIDFLDRPARAVVPVPNYRAIQLSEFGHP